MPIYAQSPTTPGYIAPINLFEDKAHLDTHGRQSAHAVLISFGSFRNNILRLKGSREPLAVIPPLAVTAAEGKLVGASKLRHRLAKTRAVCERRTRRGFSCRLGELRRMVPVMAVLTGDIAELWPALHI